MMTVIENLRQFAAQGFSFPNHTSFIWAAYGISFLVLLALFVMTQWQMRRQKRLALDLKKTTEAAKNQPSE